MTISFLKPPGRVAGGVMAAKLPWYCTAFAGEKGNKTVNKFSRPPGERESGKSRGGGITKKPLDKPGDLRYNTGENKEGWQHPPHLQHWRRGLHGINHPGWVFVVVLTDAFASVILFLSEQCMCQIGMRRCFGY